MSPLSARPGPEPEAERLARVEGHQQTEGHEQVERAEQTAAAPTTEAHLPSPARERPPWSYVFAALGLAAVSLALALGAIISGSSLGGGDGDRDEALDAARQRTVALTSYDFRRLDQDFTAVLDTSTGPFSEEYAKATGELRESFTASETVATSTVLAAGLESFGAGRAVAVVAVDQVLASKGAQPRTERNRLRMTLVEADGTWLVEMVERL